MRLGVLRRTQGMTKPQGIAARREEDQQFGHAAHHAGQEAGEHGFSAMMRIGERQMGVFIDLYLTNDPRKFRVALIEIGVSPNSR